jgi:hypothetical protein
MDTAEFKQLAWFDDNQVLETYLDSIGYPSSGGSGIQSIVENNIRYRVPVKFWIYRDDNGIGGPNQAQIQAMMDNLNRLFNQANNTQIAFYIKCDPTYINNSEHLVKTQGGATLLIATNRDYGCINVHVVDRIQGAAGLAIKSFSGLIINRTTYVDNTTTLAHEVGHVFGLLHTHQYSDRTLTRRCFVECVSRTREWPLFNFCPTSSRWKKVCESTEAYA